MQASLCAAPVPAANKPVCETLVALKEYDLPADAWRNVGGPVARVTMMPSGQPALSIRVIGMMMTVRRLDRGRIDIDRTVPLSDGERRKLVDAGAAAWSSVGPNADAPTFAPCKSANIIAAETNLNGLVKFAVSHCVALKPLRSLADAYLNLASDKVPQLKQGLEQSLD